MVAKTEQIDFVPRESPVVVKFSLQPVVARFSAKLRHIDTISSQAVRLISLTHEGRIYQGAV